MSKMQRIVHRKRWYFRIYFGNPLSDGILVRKMWWGIQVRIEKETLGELSFWRNQVCTRVPFRNFLVKRKADRTFEFRMWNNDVNVQQLWSRVEKKSNIWTQMWSLFEVENQDSADRNRKAPAGNIEAQRSKRRAVGGEQIFEAVIWWLTVWC